jgi:hypothetical protein
LGQLHVLPRRSIAVRFTPVSGIDLRTQALPGRARTYREQLQYGGPLDRVADFRDNLRNQRVASLLPQ